MHELSIVMGIVDLVEQQVKKHHARTVERIDLQIGELAGIDWSALDFAWEVGVPKTILADAKRVVEQIPGEAKCLDCDATFHMSSLTDPCPLCHQYLTQIQKGRELRIKSLVVQ